MLRTIFPVTAPVDDLLGRYLDDQRQVSGRPWVMVNMISSVDGATTIEGKSSQLGDEDDAIVFSTIRSVPDVILVGAGTVGAEDYRPLTLDEERRTARAARGRSVVPVLAIVSGRLSLDAEARVFSDPDHKPMVITGADANPSKLALLGDAAEVVILADLDPASILSHLGAASVVLLEGGPSLNAQFVEAGLVDEVNLTVSPKLVGGGSSRIAQGPGPGTVHKMRLDRAMMGERSLFLRYIRAEGS